MLKSGGRFFLFDIVFPSAAEDMRVQLDAWVVSIAEQSGPELAAEAEIHIREEYSTYDWVMEGLLKRRDLRSRALNMMMDFRQHTSAPGDSGEPVMRRVVRALNLGKPGASAIKFTLFAPSWNS